MKILSLIVLMGIVSGCKSSLHPNSAFDSAQLLAQAQELLGAGEFYKARKLTMSVLEKDPANVEAQGLMGQILEREIAKQKAAFDESPVEELSAQEKARQVRTWLERSQLLLEMNEYEQAEKAAEKVFLYDGENEKASRLIDEIRKKAWQTERREGGVLQKMSQEEMGTRMMQYRQNAKARMEANQWAVAQLDVEKMLLLAPEDDEARKLLRQIQEHKQTQR